MPRFNPVDLAAWSGGRWRGSPVRPLTGISADSRSVSDGDCFVAVEGERFDGHDFLDAAFRRGAAAAVVSSAYASSRRDGAPLLVVDDTRVGLMSMAAGYRDTLRATMIGVTGSVGKTTVKELIADMLATRTKVARNPGNWNNEIGLPLSLLQTEPDTGFGVYELGMSHPGEIARLARVARPQIGVVTTVGPVHLQFFDSEADIANEKAALLRALPADGSAVIASDETWSDVLARAAACPVTTVAMDDGAEYVAVSVGADPLTFTIREAGSGESASFRAALPGVYFKRNALLAVACCRRLGMGWDGLVRAVEMFEPEPHRWTILSEGGLTIVDDSYNANPISMRASVEAFRDVPGRRWLVLGGMLELGAAAEDLHRDLGGSLASGPWAGLILLGPWGTIIAEGATRAGMEASRIVCCDNHERVVDALAARIEPGDAVLLKASRGERLEQVRELWIERCRDQRCPRAGIRE